MNLLPFLTSAGPAEAPAPLPPSFRYGTVTHVAPAVRVTFDGPGEVSHTVSVVLVEGLEVGDRVQVMRQGGRLHLMGRVQRSSPPHIQSWGSENASWTGLALSSSSRVIGTIILPAVDYDRRIFAKGLAVVRAQTISSGTAQARTALSVHTGVVTNAQVRVPIYQTSGTSGQWQHVSMFYDHMIPAGVSSNVRLWHWNENGTSITWQYDRGASGETSQLSAVAVPLGMMGG